MEGRPLDGRSGQLHRRQMRHRGQHPCAPDLDRDVLHDGRLLFRRILVGKSPAGRLGRRAQALLESPIVHFDDHAIGLEFQLASLLAPLLDEGADLFEARAAAGVRVDAESEFAEPLQRFRLRGRKRRRLHDRVEPGLQAAASGDTRVEQLHRSSRGVARIGKERQTLFLTCRVDLLERLLRIEDLASDLERARLGNRQGNRPDRADVSGHVVAAEPIAARRPARQNASFVPQGDRKTIDLQFRDVGRGILTKQPAGANEPGLRLLPGIRVFQREHRRPVRDCREAFGRGSCDPARRRVGCRELRVLLFDRDKLAHQGVKFGIGDLRERVNVVETLVPPDFAGQLPRAFPRLLGRRLHALRGGVRAIFTRSFRHARHATVTRMPSAKACAIALAGLALPASGLAQSSPLTPPIASYDISCRLDTGKKAIEGTELLTWTNGTARPADTLQFHLYLNAFRNTRSSLWKESRGEGREGGRRPDSWGSVELLRMTLQDNTDLLPTLSYISPDDGNPDDRTVAEVRLPRPVAPGETISVTSDFFSDFGNYAVSIDVPAFYKGKVGATGRQVEERLSSDRIVYRFRQASVHDFAWTADPAYLVVRDKFHEAGLRDVDLILLLQPEHSGQRERTLRAARAGISGYGRILGAYPYGTLTIVDPPWG